MSISPSKKQAFFNIALVCFSLFLGMFLAEIFFRAFLYYDTPNKFLFPWKRDHPEFGVYDKSHWEYDEKFGFIYPPGRVINYTHIRNGKVAWCNVINTINKRGNIGPIRGDYDSADQKILVFGDSFPAFCINNTTFPSRLQEILHERLNKAVHVVNFGRDGTGILQIFDLAAAKIPEWKPDLAIITFTTDDITRVRIWRTSTVVNGEPRILTTIEPNPHPDISKAQDTFSVAPEANNEWCQKVKGKGGFDPIVEELEFRYRRMSREAGYWFPDPLSVIHSYLFARLVHGDAFYTGPRESFQIPRLSLDDYAKDAQFRDKLKKIRESGIPFIIIHLPIYPEVIKGKEAILNAQEQKLWKSLERITGKKIFQITDYVKMPIERAERMNASPTNFHPSPWGMNLYAKAITEILFRENLVTERGNE